MALYTGNNSLSFGIPILGVNRRDAVATLDSSYCINAINLEPEAQGLSVRGGYIVHNSIDNSAVSYVYALAAYGDSALFAYCKNAAGNHTIYDVTSKGTYPFSGSGTLVATTGTATPVDATPNTMARSIVFNTPTQYNTGTYSWDGTAWTAWGFTYGGSPIGGRVCTTYKGRVYIFETPSYTTYAGAAYMYYGGLAAVTGATTRIDVSSLLKDDSVIKWAGVIGSPGMQSAELFLVFGTGSGQVFIYGGDNPGAASWTQVAQFQIGRPLFWQSIVYVENDILVMTDTGVVSIQRLFQGGASELEATISGQISKLWTRLCSVYIESDASTGGGLLSSRASAAYLSKENKVYFFLNGYIDRNGADAYDYALFSGVHNSYSTIFVYNTITKGWTYHQVSSGMPRGNVCGSNPVSGGLVAFRGEIYFFSQGYIYRLSSTDFYDSFNWTISTASSSGEGAAYHYYLDTAHYRLTSSPTSVRARGVTLLTESNTLGVGNVSVAVTSDFGRRTSAYSTQSVASGVNSLVFSVGEVGSYIQANIKGETSGVQGTLGLKFYDIGVIAK